MSECLTIAVERWLPGYDWRDEVQARCILAQPDRYPALRQEWARLLLARVTRSRNA